SLFWKLGQSPRGTIKKIDAALVPGKICLNEKIYTARDSPCARRKALIFDGTFLVIENQSYVKILKL
ncbi:MAG: hypothetical protein D5R98_10020, partial [Desulfonatronovibrio sp. MSAO_Bac4]